MPADLLRQPGPRPGGRDRPGAGAAGCAYALACVRRALEALATVRGRKSLLFLSEGFLEDSGSDARAVAAASREANTAIYFVDVRGLVALPGLRLGRGLRPAARRPRAHASGLRGGHASSPRARPALATDTGGFAVRNTNDLSAGAWRVAAESRVFYLLGLLPPGGQGPSASGGSCASR